MGTDTRTDIQLDGQTDGQTNINLGGKGVGLLAVGLP